MLGVVGESGCGKSTLGRTLLGLQAPTAGEVLTDGTPLRSTRLRDMRRRVQMVFQDPYQSLNPRQTVGDLVTEPLAIHRIGRRGEERTARGVAALENAGLRPAARYWERYPHELSGGQRQRVVIAAAMVLEPEGLVCDEPVSALDVSVRAQVLHLLMQLKRERSLGLIFITHDLGVAWTLCDRIAVMYLGRIVETGQAEEVIARPRHPVHASLLSVVPTPFPRRRAAPHDPRRRAAGRLRGPAGLAASTRAARSASPAATATTRARSCPRASRGTARRAGCSTTRAAGPAAQPKNASASA